MRPLKTGAQLRRSLCSFSLIQTAESDPCEKDPKLDKAGVYVEGSTK